MATTFQIDVCWDKDLKTRDDVILQAFQLARVHYVEIIKLESSPNGWLCLTVKCEHWTASSKASARRFCAAIWEGDGNYDYPAELEDA